MKKVVKKIIEMLAVNVDYGLAGIAEDLFGWLELDNVAYEDLNEEDFEYLYENTNLTKKEVKLIYEINPYVRELTCKLYQMWEREEEENE